MTPSEYTKEIKVNTTSLRAWKYAYFYDPEHPLAYSDGTVYYHRHVASVKLGRWVTVDEHVHHIDENKLNNLSENLEVLSAAEHASHHHIGRPGVKHAIECEKCSAEIWVTPYRLGSRKFCSLDCAQESRKQFSISKEELQKLVWEIPTVEIAKRYGVSDTAIGKRCKTLGVNKPPRGYWAKQRSIKRV